MLGIPKEEFMILAVYFRCSTSSQDLEHQRVSVKNWIVSQGYQPEKVLEFEDEGISGAKSDRPGFQSLIKAVKNGEVDHILMFESSRASRNMLDYLKFMELTSKVGVKIEVVGKGIQGFESSQDMLIASIQAFLGQAERENISKRIKSGLERAKASGRVLGAPKGHTRNTGRRKKHPKEMVEEIEKWTAKGLSCQSIAEILGTRFSEKQPSYMTVRRIQQREGMKG